MTSDPSWPEIDRILEAALDLPSSERAAFLANECGDDEALRREVETLLEAALDSEDFLEVPAVSESWQGPPRIGPYRVLRELGRGGMGRVYLARRDDGTYRQDVAIKVLRGDADSGDLLRRFHSERQILAQLDHPYIGRLMDGGSTSTNRPYFVMEAIEGEPIDVYCDRRGLGISERVELFRQVCSAVQYAHQNLIIHRDLKPSNILVTTDGTPKLLDFGIAKLISDGAGSSGLTQRTETLHRALTPQYASPEQVRGERINTASDIYSLGVLLYKLLAGCLPYEVDRRTPSEVERLICEEEPPKPSTAVSKPVDVGSTEGPAVQDPEPSKRGPHTTWRPLSRSLAGDLDDIVMKALRKEPELRFSSVEQFSEDLRRYQVSLPVLARQGTIPYRASRFLRRYRLAVGVAFAFLVLILGFALTTTVQARRIAQERDEARRERAAAQVASQRAERVSSFLVDLFELSDPEKALFGETISARQLLDQGAARIETELQGQPRLQAELMATMGRVYLGLGAYPESEQLFRDVLRIHQEALDSDPLDVAQTQYDLAQALVQQGKHAEAEKECQDALDVRRRFLSGDHSELARSLNQMGELKMVTGDYPAADEFLREGLAMRRRLFGDSHEELVSSQHSLASNLLLSGDLERAEPAFREAVELAKTFLGERSPRVATITGDLAMLLGRTRRFAEAADGLRASLEIYTETLPPGHPLVAALQGNLAGILLELGEYEEAAEFALSSLELDRSLLGEEYFGTGSSLLILGRLNLFGGQLDAAEKYCQESLDVIQVQLGDSHPHTGHPRIWLGRVALARGRGVAAESFFRQALAIWNPIFPEGHPFLVKAETGLGAALMAQGHLDEGRLYLEKNVPILERQEGPDAEFTRWAREQ